jgi:Permease for cytosine/purines, uracil, thiamine, allantoin
MSEAWSALRALNVIIGLFSSLAVNMPDFGRFSKYENAGYSQFIFLPLLGTLGALSPIFVTSAVQYLWGEYIWFLPAVIAKFDNRAAMVESPSRHAADHSSSLASQWQLQPWETKLRLVPTPSEMISQLSHLVSLTSDVLPSSWPFSALPLIVTPNVS